MADLHGVHTDCPTCMCGVLGPDENSCKRCGLPVRYAKERGYSCSFNAATIVSGPYRLEEEFDDEGEPTGDWVARYVLVADRGKKRGFKKHDCRVPKR